MDANFAELILSDPVTVLELLALLFTGIYLAKLSLFTSEASMLGRRADHLQPVIECLSAHAGEVRERADLARKVSLEDQMLSLFEVGALISTRKRSLRGQRKPALLGLQ